MPLPMNIHQWDQQLADLMTVFQAGGPSRKTCPLTDATHSL